MRVIAVVLRMRRVRILLDYRPALRERTGVGEYVARARRGARPAARPTTTADAVLELVEGSARRRRRLPGARVVDARVPVRAAELRRGTGSSGRRSNGSPARVDVAHSLHPLLMPARARRAGRHDSRPGSSSTTPSGTARRDPARLPGAGRRRTRAARTPSSSSRDSPPARSSARLGVPADRIVVCPPGAPDWPRRDAAAAATGPILFVGTLEPRKNVGGLLDAYERLLATTCPTRPPLVLAGGATDAAGAVAATRSREPPLAGHVEHLGYVDEAERRRSTSGASMLVLPSLDEGFGLPVLEAMTLGVPVVAANRGALPEVAGDAGLLVDPDGRRGDRCDAMRRGCSTIRRWPRRACRARTRSRARAYSWDASAARAARGLRSDARRRRQARAMTAAAHRHRRARAARRRRPASAAILASCCGAGRCGRTRRARQFVLYAPEPLPLVDCRRDRATRARRSAAAAAPGGSRRTCAARSVAIASTCSSRPPTPRRSALGVPLARHDSRRLVRRAPRVVPRRAKGCGGGC